MKQIKNYKLLLLFYLITLGLNSCEVKQNEISKTEITQKQNIESFKLVLLKHLNAVTNKDIDALKATMSPKGNMELILPSSEILYSAKEFIKFQQDWFNIPNWTFETKVMSTNVGGKIGVATTEILYKEPDRNGKPYFNRMIVSYTLEKIDGSWYVIKDHASSIEKTVN